MVLKANKDLTIYNIFLAEEFHELNNLKSLTIPFFSTKQKQKKIIL